MRAGWCSNPTMIAWCISRWLCNMRRIGGHDSGILPDAEPRAPDPVSVACERHGADSARYQRALRDLSKRATGRQRTRVAGTILLVPDGFESPVERAAIHRAESRASRIGAPGG